MTLCSQDVTQETPSVLSCNRLRRRDKAVEVIAPETLARNPATEVPNEREQNHVNAEGKRRSWNEPSRLDTKNSISIQSSLSPGPGDTGGLAGGTPF